MLESVAKYESNRNFLVINSEIAKNEIRKHSFQKICRRWMNTNIGDSASPHLHVLTCTFTALESGVHGTSLCRLWGSW